MTVRGYPRPSLPQRVTGLESAVEDQRRQLAALGRQRPPRYDRGRELFLGVTAAYAQDDPTYPAPPANKFRIQFLDPSFTATLDEPWEDLAQASRAGTDDVPVVALNTTGCYLPEGTLVWLARRKPLASVAAAGSEGCWYIVKADLVTELLIKTPSGGIPAADGATLGHAVCDVQVPTGGEDDEWVLANPQSWTETVFNVSESPVAGDKRGKAAREGYAGLLIVDVESCS